MNSKPLSDAIWPIISNREVLEVNDAWAGHSGSPFWSSSSTVNMTMECCEDYEGAKGPSEVPAQQYWYKPIEQGGAKTAVLLMNNAPSAVDLTLTFADIPGVSCLKCHLRDIVAKQDLGVFAHGYSAKAVPSHDAMFLVITPAPGANVPGANAPGANAPGANAPAADVPAASAPAVNVPAANAPAANAPAAKAPAANVPAADAPVPAAPAAGTTPPTAAAGGLGRGAPAVRSVPTRAATATRLATVMQPH